MVTKNVLNFPYGKLGAFLRLGGKVFMGFSEEHTKWLESHIQRRSGERKGRLERGHAHGERLFLERVWWPMFGNLNDLHPEYEVADWRGRPYFVDFAWLTGQFKFALEVKGYAAHVQQSDRTRYRHELNRETFLQILGFRVVSIPYDDLDSEPSLTINLLKSLLSPYMAASLRDQRYTRLERDALSIILRLGKPVRPLDLINELEINRRTAVVCLKSLCEKGKLRPILSCRETRVYRYEFVRSFTDDWVW
jgi:hypothetical protein